MIDCSYEREYSQRHLEEFKAERESSGLHMAIRVNWAMRGGQEKQERRTKKQGQKREGTRRQHEMTTHTY